MNACDDIKEENHNNNNNVCTQIKVHANSKRAADFVDNLNFQSSKQLLPVQKLQFPLLLQS